MKKAYTLIELLAVIVILSILSAIAYPKVIDAIGASKIGAYNTAKNNIIDVAKISYLADVNSAVVTEYSVVDLINKGKIKKGTKNPLTNEEYDENTKVLITNKDGHVTYDYIEGNTLYDLVSKKNNSDGVYKQDSEFIYKGIDAKNYISFNGEIYRIIKVDLYRDVYLLKEEDTKQVLKDNINDYIKSYYNDTYSEFMKKKVSNIDLLDYALYKNSFINSETYINNNHDIWIKDSNDYKVLSSLTNTFNNDNKAYSRFVIKLNSNIIIQSGEGTQLTPYMVQE